MHIEFQCVTRLFATSCPLICDLLPVNLRPAARKKVVICDFPP